MSVLWEMIPILLGVLASPLAIMALMAVLLTRRPGANGLAFVAGWALAVSATTLGAYLLLAWAGVDADREPPVWMIPLRLVIGALLVGGAVFTYRQSRGRIAAMAAATTPEEVAAAAPQLPGWLTSVSTFSPARSMLLGFGIFALNPMNDSCSVAAALELRQAQLPPGVGLAVLICFVVLCVIPFLVPVILVVRKGELATPLLEKVKGSIERHNGTLSAVFLALVGFSQVRTALGAL